MASGSVMVGGNYQSVLPGGDVLLFGKWTEGRLELAVPLQSVIYNVDGAASSSPFATHLMYKTVVTDKLTGAMSHEEWPFEDVVKTMRAGVTP
jgi:hypothetical protein